MNPVDPSAVWERVYADIPSEPALSYQLTGWVNGERQAAVTYYHMAHMAGPDAPDLRHMAQECAGHGRTLSAIYYFLTGQRMEQPQAPTVPTGDLPALLSQRYRAELDAAKTYRGAAQQHPQNAIPLHTLADESERHAQQLLRLAERHI